MISSRAPDDSLFSTRRSKAGLADSHLPTLGLLKIIYSIWNKSCFYFICLVFFFNAIIFARSHLDRGLLYNFTRVSSPGHFTAPNGAAALALFYFSLSRFLCHMLRKVRLTRQNCPVPILITAAASRTCRKTSLNPWQALVSHEALEHYIFDPADVPSAGGE